MERDDDTTTDRPADTTTGDHTRDERPAGPSQPGEGGFEEGAEQTSEESERTPDFARGVHAEDDDTGEVEGRYSRGAEDAGTEEASKEGRFSEGIEQLPHDRD